MQIGITLIKYFLVEEDDYFFCSVAHADLLVLKI